MGRFSRKVKTISSLRFHGSCRLFVSVVGPFEQKVASRVCSCTRSLGSRQMWRRVTGQILSDSASAHSSPMELLCMATPGAAPCGGSLCGRGLGLIGCCQWTDRCWLDLLNSCSFKAPPNQKHVFNFFKIPTRQSYSLNYRRVLSPHSFLG